jgi:hypothetical protein
MSTSSAVEVTVASQGFGDIARTRRRSRRSGVVGSRGEILGDVSRLHLAS